MPDKFENATLLLRIRLPSTLICLYQHKNISENYWNFLKIPYRVEQFENETFFVLMWTENFLYPQLFEYVTLMSFCPVIYLQHGVEHNIFCVVYNNHLL